MESEQLKERLQAIAQPNDKITRATTRELLPAMLRLIGSTDSNLRELIYSSLSTWIFDGHFTADELQTLLQQALDDEHLFYKLGEENTDSVFTRAFSVLLIPPILGLHRKEPFLKPDTLHDTLERVADYLRSEKDLRGYVRGKGWAHAVAHTADALDEFVQCTELGRDDLQTILELIAEIISTTKSVYICGEDERLAFAVTNAFKRAELSKADKEGWPQSFTPLVNKAGETPDPEGYQSFINIKHFLRTLYFSLLQNDVPEQDNLTQHIQRLLNHYNNL
jgi:Protein of unknown function (DUF2785)